MPLRDPSSLGETERTALADLLADLLEPPAPEEEPSGSDEGEPSLLGFGPGAWLAIGAGSLVGGVTGQLTLGLLWPVGSLILAGAVVFGHRLLGGLEDKEEETGDREASESPEASGPARRITAVGCLDLLFEESDAGDGTLLLGPSSLADELELEVPRLAQPDEVRDLVGRLDDLLSEAPHVLASSAEPAGTPDRDGRVVLHGQERDLHRALTSLGELLSDREVERHRLAAVPPDDPLRDILERPQGDGAAGDSDPEAPDLRDLQPSELDRDLEEALERWGRRHQLFHALRLSSLSGTIAPLCYNLGDSFHYSGFNLYCSRCNADRIEELLERDYSVQGDQDHPPIRYPDETRCVYDPDEERWRCRSCDREAEDPIPVHKSLDEVFLPVYNRLMDEHKNERLDIYSSIRDQELDYMNQCRSEMEEVARTGRESIEEMETQVVQARARIKGEEQALASFVDILEAYQDRQRQAVREIRRNTEEIRENVREENERVRKRLEEISRRSRKRLTAENTRLARAQKIEEQRRDEVQREILKDVRATAARTSEIAENTGQMTGHLREIKDTQERKMHIQAAMAEESGVEIGASRWDFVGKLREGSADFKSAIAGEDDVDRAARKEEALS